MIHDYAQSISCFPLFAIAIGHSAVAFVIGIRRMPFDQWADRRTIHLKPTFMVQGEVEGLHSFKLCFAGVL
jgi:hypothetical protein